MSKFRKRNIFLNFAAASLLAFAASGLSAATVEANYRVSAVTVYSDRALVTLTGTAELPAGRHAVRFSKLPGDLRADSVSCSAGDGLKIHGIELQRELHDRPVNAELRRLQKELEALKDEERRLGYERQADEAQLKFIDSLQAASGEKIARELPLASPVAEWEKTLSFMDRKRKDRYDALLQNDIRKRELSRRVKVKQEELQRLSRSPGTRTRSIVAHVDATGSGRRAISVRYVIPRARWTPSYDIRASSGLDELELTYYGTVSQETGENWQDVKLALSTARPGLGASPPALQPIELTPGRVTTALRNAGGDTEAERDDRAESKTRIVSEPGAPTVLYEVPGRQTIPTGDRPRKVAVSVDRFKLEPIYVCRPRSSRFAFIRAEIRNETPRQFLPGAVSVFLGGDFVGRTRLGGVAPGQPFSAYLGVDERLKVTRKPILDRSQEAFWGDNLVLAQGFSIKLENYTGRTRKILVYDQIPVSRDAAIKVRNFKADPDARLAEESGEILWELELKAGATRTLEFQFEVVFPPEVYKQRGMRKALDEMRSMW